MAADERQEGTWGRNQRERYKEEIEEEEEIEEKEEETHLMNNWIKKGESDSEEERTLTTLSPLFVCV